MRTDILGSRWEMAGKVAFRLLTHCFAGNTWHGTSKGDGTLLHRCMFGQAEANDVLGAASGSSLSVSIARWSGDMLTCSASNVCCLNAVPSNCLGQVLWNQMITRKSLHYVVSMNFMCNLTPVPFETTTARNPPRPGVDYQVLLACDY